MSMLAKALGFGDNFPDFAGELQQGITEYNAKLDQILQTQAEIIDLLRRFDHGHEKESSR